MSRKNRAPQRIIYNDPKYGSLTLSKFINFVMYDGKKAAAEKLIYDALKQIGEKTKEDPIKVFNDAIFFLVFLISDVFSNWPVDFWNFKFINKFLFELTSLLNDLISVFFIFVFIIYFFPQTYI